ncbi:MAG TPA: terminase family protein [Myxococcales bacterium]|nr:terminase family protein [Myxococcales bacterium]
MGLSLLQRALQHQPPEVVARALGNRQTWPWEATRRPEQELPPGDWTFWLALAGRGWGKTRTGAEAFRQWFADGFTSFAAAGRTGDDVRKVMVEGESGLLATFHQAGVRAVHKPGLRTVFLGEGKRAKVELYSAHRPDAFRGPQFQKAWADEFAAWKYVDAAWMNLQMGLRRGPRPQAVVTTTPRPIPVLRALIDRAKKAEVKISRGTTYENRANLAPEFYSRIITAYEGTRLGRQELDAEMLDDTPGALWRREQLEQLRWRTGLPAMLRRAVAIDPAVSTRTGSAETGIIGGAVGLCDCKGADKIEKHIFVLEDATGKRLDPTLPVHLTPRQWAKAGISLYRKLAADRVVGEGNNGGELVEENLRVEDPTVPFSLVWASEGKRTRAEPIAALYEQGKVHHVGMFAELEDQMCTWAALTSGERSPDRLDALVWLCAEFLPMLQGPATAKFKFLGGDKRRI